MGEAENLAKEMAKMSEDLISEILVRLPVKSLSRYRCVCKAWFHLIKSPRFINMHLRHSNTKTDLILLYRNINFSDGLVSTHAYESFDFISQLHLDPFLKICGPCNGILCLLDVNNQLRLVNPSNKTGLDLPRSPFLCRKGWNYSIDGFGFGSVSNQNDCKVVLILSFYQCKKDPDADEPANKVEIYNLSTKSWREIECDYRYTFHGDECATLFNGALHWVALKEGVDIIPSFSLSTEVFQDLELPSDLHGKDGINKSLTVVNDSLALFAFTSYYHNSEEQFVDIWVMKEYAISESWTKQFSIGPLSRINNPLILWKNEALLILSSSGQLHSCALDTHEIEEVKIEGDRGSMKVMVYHESLISLE